MSWGQTGRSPTTVIDDAIALEKNGSPRAALAMLEGVEEHLRKSRDDANLARALGASSEAAFSLGEYHRAIGSSTEAAGIHRRAGDMKAEANDWNTVGRANVYLGNYTSGIESYQRALALDRRRGDIEGEIVRLNNIGNAYFEQGRYLEAYQQYESALARVRENPGQKWTARRNQIVTANLAMLFQRLGRYQRALDLYLSVSQQSDSTTASERAQFLANLGTLYRRLGDSQKALETYRESQALYQKDHHPFGESGVLKNTGIVLALDLGRLAEALAAFQAARELAVQSAGGQLASIDLYIGEALRQLGQYGAARGSFESALSGARKAGSSEYEWQALLGLGRLEEQAGRQDGALQLYRQAIARIESVRSGLELPVLRREFLGDKRQVYDAALAILLDRPDPPEDLVFELMEHSRARVLQDRMFSSRPKYGLKEIQERLTPGTVLLEFWAAPTRGAVLTITHSEVKVLRRPMVDAARFRAAAIASEAGWRAMASQTGGDLLSDIVPLGAEGLRSIIVVPDGILGVIPFELLAAPGFDQLLIEKAPVSYLPSASFLLRRKPDGRGWAFPWRRELLAFADPAPQAGTAPASADGFGGEAAGWARLPMAAEEVRAIRALLPGRSILHIASDATKQRLIAESTGVPLLHVSTHATADPIDPERSRILLAPQRAQDGADFLFLREIYGLNLKGIDLVVLSACDTETGKLAGGEGVEGFSKAFLAAGANSAVTTLWRVEDDATAEFMKQFYYVLASGASKAEALRAAKLRFLHSGSKLARPQYWAAFILNGDGASSIPRVVSWGTIAIGAALALLTGIAAARLRSRRSNTVLIGSKP